MELRQHTTRRAVAGIFAAIIIFGILFTAGVAYFTFQAKTAQTQNAANIYRQNAIEQSNLERVSLSTIVSGGSGSYTVTLLAENTGGIATTIVADYASNGGALINPPGITTQSLSLGIGASASITLTGIPDASGMVSVITSRGNTFSAPFPQPSLSTTTTITTSYSTNSTTTTIPGTAGTNTLVVQMVATPAVTFSCHNGCVLDNVTVYNYAALPVTNVALYPNPPTIETCGNTPGCTASLTAFSCAGPYNSDAQSTTNSIGPYSGTGNGPDIFYLCTYNASTGTLGGFASFSGQATGVLNTNNIESAESISNTIQIGGSANVEGQGPFSVNFFVFKYSSCYKDLPSGTQSSGGPYSYPSGGCTTTPATMPPALFRNLGNASLISSGSNQYVALYFQITNDFNSTLAILKYTFVQFESAISAGESDMYIVGGPNNQSSIYPNYCHSGGGNPATCASNNLPVFTPYTATATSCAETENEYGIYEPPATTCINVSPGRSAVLTLAACGPGSPSWDWGGTQYATQWDSGNSGCVDQKLDLSSNGEPTALILVIAYLYNNVVFTEDVAFQSTSVIP